MIPQSKGKIFLAAERGATATDWFRSYHTFCFGAYQHPDKTPIAPLSVLNDDTLAGGRSLQQTMTTDADIVVVPVVGTVVCSDTTAVEHPVTAGQALQFNAVAGTHLSFRNPYPEEPIRFLQLRIGRQPEVPFYQPATSSFRLDEEKDRLIGLFPDSTTGNIRFFIGRFGGRQETYFSLPNNKRLFCYVIEGAFEVAYRLLETGDALGLWDAETAAIEALSDDAILLVMELPVP